jgi:hypothetical protein
VTVRTASLHRLERRLARLYRKADGPRARAELIVALTRTFAVHAATHTHRRHHPADPAAQAEVEQILRAAIDHLHATERRQAGP